MTGSTVRIGGEVVVMPSGTAPQDVDVADQLLAEQAMVKHGGRVLLLGAGNGALAVVVARRVGGGEVVVVDQRAHALAAAAATLKLNAATARFLPTTELALLPPAYFDLALVNIAFQSNSTRLVELLRETHRVIPAGGRVYIAGARDRGAETVIKRLGELFGGARLVGYRKGYRIGMALRSASPLLEPAPAALKLSTVELRGSTYILEANPGVFASGAIDPAAMLLANTMQVAGSDEVLDLGCGNGIVGMVAARLAEQGHVWLVDTNSEAVWLTKRNIERNAIVNATVLVSDSTAAVSDRRFDVVVSNPPFHESGREARNLGQRFIADAAEVLWPGGRCFIVANRFLPYEAAMRARLSDVCEVAGDTRYKVLSGVRSMDAGS